MQQNIDRMYMFVCGVHVYVIDRNGFVCVVYMYMFVCVVCMFVCVCNAATLHCYKHIHLVARNPPGGRGRATITEMPNASYI